MATPVWEAPNPSQWASPAQLLELIDLDPAARQATQAYLPRFEFLLDALTRPDGKSRGRHVKAVSGRHSTSAPAKPISY